MIFLVLFKIFILLKKFILFCFKLFVLFKSIGYFNFVVFLKGLLELKVIFFFVLEKIWLVK